MPANNFNNGQGNFTVADVSFPGRVEATTGLQWTFADFEALYNAAVGLNMRDVPSGSPSVQTYRTWFHNAGLFLYTNP